MIDHITESMKPHRGKAISASDTEPCSAASTQTTAPKPNSRKISWEVEQLQQYKAQHAAYHHQPPKEADFVGSGRFGGDAVIDQQELAHPIGEPLLGADVSHDPDEKQQYILVAKQSR